MITSPAATQARPASAVTPRPLMPVSAVMWRLGLECSEDDVLELIENGRLAWAFNIALDPNGARDLRVLTEALSDHLTGRTRAAHPDDEAEFQRVTGLILSAQPFITAADLARSLCCSGTHLLNLISKGQFQLKPGSPWTTGPAGSPQIERTSILVWLRARRVL